MRPFELDEFQLKFYNETLHPDHAYIINAVAGAGKSTTIIAKSIKLINDIYIPPHKILLTSFTNKSARELESRLKKYSSTTPLVSTLHGFGKNILNLTNYSTHSIITEWQSILATRDAITTLYPTWQNATKKDLTSLAIHIQYCYSKFRALNIVKLATLRDTLMLAFHSSVSPLNCALNASQTANVIIQYEKIKKDSQFLDYDDLIWLTLQPETPTQEAREFINNIDYYFIDEAQDLNQAQYDLILMCAKNKTLTMVGDRCQSIYGFRFATPSNFSTQYLSTYYSNTTELSLLNNYRSTPAIVKVSNICRELCKDPYHALPNQPHIQHSVKVSITKNNIVEGQFINKTIIELLSQHYKPSDITIICRTNNYIKTCIEPNLVKDNIQYTLIGGDSYKQFLDKPVAMFFLSLIQYFDNNKNVYALHSLANYLKGFGTKAQEQILNGTTPPALVSILSHFNAQVSTFKHDIYQLPLIIDNLLLQHANQELIDNERQREQMITAFSNYISLQIENGVSSLHEILSSIINEAQIFLQDDSQNKIKLATIHSQKGLENKIIFATGFNSQNKNKSFTPEEANLLYVQVSRAIEKLYIVSSNDYITNKGSLVDNYQNPYVRQLISRLREL